jgi:hypothetical protein
MRFCLFYSSVESFNYFTDRIAEELAQRGHACFILDLNHMSAPGPHSFEEFTHFLTVKADAAVAFDGLGIKEDIFIELWDSMNTRAVNILMDHPLRFHPTMSKHPKNYIQFCCDRNHVEYVRKYFDREVPVVEFLPHAGTYMRKPDLKGYIDRPYDVLFSGTFYEPQNYLNQIDKEFEKNEFLREFYHNLSEYMIKNHSLTTEQAVLDMAAGMNLELMPEQLKTMFACAEPIDWMARMYYRKKIIQIIAEAGIQIWLLGRGWENHPCADKSNVHIISGRVPFQETLPVMNCAKINLNVMPWFKDGTHDRIFNIFLQGSLALTDASQWLFENFENQKDIVYYDLDRLEEIPEIIQYYLTHTDQAENVIRNGFEIVKNQYTWKNIVDQILDALGLL